MSIDRWLTVHDVAQEFAMKDAGIKKEELAQRVSDRFALSADRSVFYADDMAVRFSHASGQTFSNCVVSLSVIRKYDDRPFLVCILRPSGIETLIANSTFISKVSHSSQQLSLTKLRGTILGHDILREFDDLSNTPHNFAELYARHREFTWDENFHRIVERTTAITPTGKKYMPSDQDRDRILKSVNNAALASQEGYTHGIERELQDLLDNRKDRILQAASRDNVNIRGNAIEQIMTEESNLHRCEDLLFSAQGDLRVLVDIKSKLLHRASSPKMYNIDKLLQELADGRTLMAFFFIGIDLPQATVTCRLVNVFDRTILAATRVQFHWAGRNSRGVTQLTGSIRETFDPGFRETIDAEAAGDFINGLLDK